MVSDERKLVPIRVAEWSFKQIFNGVISHTGILLNHRQELVKSLEYRGVKSAWVDVVGFLEVVKQ